MISSWLSRSRQHRISPNASSSSVRASAEIPADSVSEPLSDGARSEAEELARLVIEYEGEASPKSAVRSRGASSGQLIGQAIVRRCAPRKAPRHRTARTRFRQPTQASADEPCRAGLARRRRRATRRPLPAPQQFSRGTKGELVGRGEDAH